MKIVKLQLCLIVLIAAVCNSAKQPTTRSNLGDKSAQSSKGEGTESVSYALGSNGGYTIKNENNYKTPEMVPKLVHAAPFDNTIKTQSLADEVPSITDYYDGANRLNAITVMCKVHVNMNDCLHQSGCGWCKGNTYCVNGNQAGPLEACDKSTYIFTTGALHEERVVQQNVGALSMTIVSK